MSESRLKRVLVQRGEPLPDDLHEWIMRYAYDHADLEAMARSRYDRRFGEGAYDRANLTDGVMFTSAQADLAAALGVSDE